jgi:hypothetical protein
MVVAGMLVPCTDAGGQEPPVTGLRAGAATSNITPPLGSIIVGGFNPFPAKHIHDDLYARCLVLDDGRTKLVFVLVDNVGIPREVYDAAKGMIHAETGLYVENMLMAATHTHSAASARGVHRLLPNYELTEYQEFIARRIADGVQCALNNLEPARVGWGRAEEPSQVFNRRWHMTDPEPLRNPFGGVDKVRMNPPRAAASLVRPAGPTDPEISFFSVQSRDGRPIALLANYSLHYVGGVRGADISADYFGMFAGRIAELLQAEKLDPPFVGILSNGTSGDVNNINFREQGERLAPYVKMRRVADLVAQKVYEAHQQITFRDDVTLAAAQEELDLAVRMPSEELVAWATATLDKPEDPKQRYHVNERAYADRVLDLVGGPDKVTIVLQAFRVGDVGITAIPFETFAETGLSIKEHSPIQPTFNIELANGSYGYLPTPPQHELGGYETWLGTNVVEQEASVKIEAMLLELLGRVKQAAK